MIVAVHSLVGAALGRWCATHAQAFAVGFASHLPCDAVPHRDLAVPQEAALLGAALGLIGALRGPTSKEFLGALGAAAPDIENLLGRALRVPDDRLLLPTHSKYHGRDIRGVRGQVALAVCCLAALAWPGRSP